MPSHTLCLSVVVITHNEEARLTGCLESVRILTNDIVVVDSQSHDRTAEMARAAGARVFERPWPGYSAQKNFGNAQARYDWILSLDADERVSAELAWQLQREFGNGPRCDVYDIRFANYFGAHQVRFGAWNPEWHARLFDRRKFSWNTDDVHEGLCGPEEFRRGRLHGAIQHFTVESRAQLVRKWDRYAAVFATTARRYGRQASWTKVWLNPVWRFARDYFLRLGALDGVAGLVIAWEAARYTHWKYRPIQAKARRSKIAEWASISAVATALAIGFAYRTEVVGLAPASNHPAAAASVQSGQRTATGAPSFAQNEGEDDNNATLETLPDDDDIAV